jgi:uncharacterized SAM-binding protein YcdF (DUF218 family)
MLRLIRICAIVLARAVVCVAIIYFSIPMADTKLNQFDVILVLGNPARNDGSIGLLAKSRVLEGIRQYRAGVAVANQFVEAQVMLQFAESQGVPASALLAEGQSRNTIQNAYYSYKIMQAHGWTSALVVSSPYHLRRASLIFSHFPLAWRMDAAPWPPGFPLWMQLWFWAREAALTSYSRLAGFPNARQYLPNTHFTLPRL